MFVERPKLQHVAFGMHGLMACIIDGLVTVFKMQNRGFEKIPLSIHLYPFVFQSISNCTNGHEVKNNTHIL